MLTKLPVRGMVAALCLLLAALCVAAGQDYAGPAAMPWPQAQRDYSAGGHATNALRFARACFTLAGRATNDTQRAAFARQGADACRRWLVQATNSAAGHYFLAMNLGELAQAEAPSLTAYRLVHEVEREFLAAAGLDVHFDHAGPARSLGQLYFQAPGWPLSVGSKRKAREWFECAATVAPGYPPNLLDLAEAQLKWRERDALEKSLEKITALWPAAKTNFAGEAWVSAWPEWDARRAALQTNWHRLYGAKP